MIIHASSKSYSPAELNVIKDTKPGIPLVLVTRTSDFIFNEQLTGLKKYALVDLCEYGWDEDLKRGTHFFGDGKNIYPELFHTDEWKKFDDFVAANPPLVYFKRELLKQDMRDNIFPIDYPCFYYDNRIQTKDTFNGRPINVFHYWGRSSEDRVKVHADFWMGSSRNGASICDNLYYVDSFLKHEENKNKWVSVCIPHYSRIDISNILAINGMSKLSLSMKGCGFKCFRHAESPINSVMVMQDAGIKFTYDWVHGENCIMYKDNPVQAIEQALERSDLYDIYLKGIETIDKYRPHNYNKYIEETIIKCL